MKIKIGRGTHGDILGDYEQYKACNFCVNFQGYGIHWCAGKCLKLNKEIGGGYTGGYSKAAKECGFFECRTEYLIN